MTEKSPSREPAQPWSVSGDEAGELMRLHRQQLIAFDRTAEDEKEVGADLSLDDIPEDLRALVAEYEKSRPGVTLRPLRYITIGGTAGPNVAGTAELPDEGIVTFVFTRTIADGERADVTSRVLVAGTTSHRVESA
jgi:hypothetical protein